MYLTKIIPIVLILLITNPQNISAALPLKIYPQNISEQTTPRDILKKNITLVNYGDAKLLIYATVRNVQPDGALEPFIDPSKANLATSAAHWVRITRGVIPLAPKEQKNIELEIRPSPLAKTGQYRVAIHFSEGENRAVAEKQWRTSPALTIDLDLDQALPHRLAIEYFRPRQRLKISRVINFDYKLNLESETPNYLAGELRLYDRRGKQIDTIPLSAKNLEATRSPQSITWTNTYLGRYEAVLSLEYGQHYRRRATARTSGAILPWSKIIILFFIGLSLALLVSLGYYKLFYEKNRN